MLKQDVKNGFDRLIKSGHFERLQTIEAGCFESPVVITVKTNGKSRNGLPQTKRELRGKRPHMQNMVELLYQIYTELSRNNNDPIWISVINLEYANGLMNLAPGTSKHCNFAVTGENMNEYYRFLKRK